METTVVVYYVMLLWGCTDPTYKEWKRKKRGQLFEQKVKARILPTRNGNIAGRVTRICVDCARILPNMGKTYVTGIRHGSYLQGMETYSRMSWTGRLSWQHGSYLQGMETLARKEEEKEMRIVHGSYLQGMETRDYFRELFKEGGTDPTYKEWKRR